MEQTPQPKLVSGKRWGTKNPTLVVATQAFCAIKQTIFSRLEDLLTHISYLTVIQPEVAMP